MTVHIAVLIAAILLYRSLGVTEAAIFTVIPAIFTAFLLGFRIGIVSAAIINFVEVPILYHLAGYGYIEGFLLPDAIPGSLALFGISAAVGYLYDIRIHLRAQQKEIQDKNSEIREYMDIKPLRNEVLNKITKELHYQITENGVSVVSQGCDLMITADKKLFT